MLTNKKISIVADTLVEGTKIASHAAIINMHTGELNMTSRHIDADACKVHKHFVRKDRSEFEDSVYEIQDILQGMVDTEE